MPKEYEVIISSDPKSIKSKLNELGEQGYTIATSHAAILGGRHIQAVKHCVIMEREKQCIG